MNSLYNSKYANKYETNKYIWENESDKNSKAAQKAATENQAIRDQLGIGADTMNYEDFKNARANYSDYYDIAKSLTINPEYKEQSDKLYNQINNFSYDATNDPNYIAFVNAAKRQSESAQKQTYANMTKSSGGRNNSYASAATAQVGQAYAEKINDYAKTLAEEAYDKLIKKYELSVEKYNDDVDRTNSEYEKYMKLSGDEVERQRNVLKDQRDARESNVDFAIKMNKYKTELEEYETLLRNNRILNDKNEYEYQRWLEDPYYEIKDKTLAEAIAKNSAYMWLRENGREYLYSII